MSQLQRKFIENDAVNGSKILLDNNETLRALSAGGAAVDLLKYTADGIFELQRIPQAAAALAIPTLPKQFATIEYIQNYLEGKVDAKDAVNAVADTNVSLTGAGAQTFDGVAFTQMTPPMRLALTGQTDPIENGIYDYAFSGGNYTLTRSFDFDQVNDASGREVTQGAYFVVIGGTVYSGYEVILVTANPVVIGTSSIIFAKYPTAASLTAGDMLIRVGNDLAVDLQPLGGLESSNAGNQAGQLRVKTRTADLEKDRTVQIDALGNVVAKKPKKFFKVLVSGDVTNGYLDLLDVASDGSIDFKIAGAPSQVEGTDYSVNYTGGTNSKTRVTFLGGLATGGVSALAAGDSVAIHYKAF